MFSKKEQTLKQNHTVYIYKADRRTKSGERLVSTTVWQNRDEAEMKREVRELQYELWPVSKGFRIEFVATMKTVKNLMSGVEIQIPHDTPHCCDPSSETFWSM
jgi:hypothetical protein